MNDQNINVKWQQLTQLIARGRCTPIIGNSLTLNHLFPETAIEAAWAAAINYPLRDRHSLPRIAQFWSVVSGGEFEAKSDYLEFLKQTLLAQARAAANGAQPSLNLLADELPTLSVSQTAARLGLSDFSNQPTEPLVILANLPLPIYLTTSYHTLLEAALRDAGKTPHCSFYHWTTDLAETTMAGSENLPTDFQPSVDEPLVYHLLGLDEDPATLVLTEENYFEFFGKVAYDLQIQSGIPDVVRNALSTSALLLLGYDLQEWAFRVLYRGPVKAVFNQRRPFSLAIQLEPSPETGIENTEAVRRYLNDYFRGYKFSIYWGDPSGFTRDLWQQWEG